jgi:hypothetical protein
MVNKIIGGIYACIFAMFLYAAAYTIYNGTIKEGQTQEFSKGLVIQSKSYSCVNTATGFKCDYISTPTRTARPTITLTPTKTKRVLKTNTPTPEYEEEYPYPGATYNPPPYP